jgi:fumarate reductase subunit D
MASIGTSAGFCSQTVAVWQVVGYFLMMFKIVLPIVLIVIGVITFGKAVVSDDEKEIKKGYISLFKKLIVCVVVFFLPQLVTTIFNVAVDDFKDIKPDYDVCKACITSPNSDRCVDAMEARNNNNNNNDEC